MSKLTPLTKNIIDLYSKDTHKKNYQYKKVNNIHKFNGLSANSSITPNNVIKNNQFQNNLNFQTDKKFAQKIFNEAEKNGIHPKSTNNKHNININTSTIINPGINNNGQNNFQKFITINDIIGEKCELNLGILNMFFENYDQSKTSKKTMSSIKSYGVNTYQGIVRNYNEDRVSIIINMNKPKNYNKKWPKISFFGIYDGHGGEGCAEFLRDNLHKLICENDFFPDNIPEAIKFGISKAEYDFLNNYALSPNKDEILDKSGSCAIIILIVDNYIYIANVGDSRCLLSMDEGKKYIAITKDHKPNSPNEIMRIKKNGGNIYQSQTVINNLENNFLNGKILIGPYRVIPGRLSVSRTIGDAEAKIQKFGGNPNVIISTPDIFCYDLKKDNLDFFILGCDGIYDQMSNQEILDLAWMVLNNKFEHKENGLNVFNGNINHNDDINDLNNIHYKSGLIVDLILKSSLARKSFDNVTCVFIAFKDFLPKKPNGIDNNIINKEQNINSNNNVNQILNPSFNAIIPEKIPVNINSNGGVTNNLDEKNKFEKVYTIKKKSTILNKKNMYNISMGANKNKINRNEKRNELSNNNNNYRLNGIFNTESKLNSMNLHLYNEELLDDKYNTEIRADLNNGSEKNNTFRKISKNSLLNKENVNVDDINKENNNLLHNRIKTNLITYSKKNHSFNKNNKYLTKKINNYKHIKKINLNTNIYNSYATKKLSNPNSNRLNNNNNNNNSVKNNNFYTFKPITKLNKPIKPFKLIETKRSFINNSKNKNDENKNSTIINNMNNLSMNNHKYIIKAKEKNNNTYNINANHFSFNNNIYYYDNRNTINPKHKYHNKYIINNSNSNLINSFLNKNNTLKKPKKYLSLNNTQNLSFEPNHASSISNNLMINRYINNAFTTKMKRDLTSKLNQIATNKSFHNHNNLNISNPNISMQNVPKSNYIYHYADKTHKIKSYNYNYKNNTESKSYRSFTYNSNKNKNSSKYNDYLVTDLPKTKNQLFFDDNKKDIY